MRKVRIPKSLSKKSTTQLIEIRDAINGLIWAAEFKEKVNESREREDMHQVQEQAEVERLFAMLGEDS